MKVIQRFVSVLLYSSWLWGCTASVGFYALLHGGVLGGESMRRYFAGHPVNYIETIAFFIVLAALIIKMLDIIGQLGAVDDPKLACPAEARPSDFALWRTQLTALPETTRNSYIVRRLCDAIDFMDRQGHAEGLDDQLKYLHDQHGRRARDSYAFVRMFIWGIPILGMLSTVSGIPIAIGSLSPEALEQSLPDMTAGLGVAFDTSALAMGLSMILMLAQRVADRSEQRLLGLVDSRAYNLLGPRFASESRTRDPQLAAIRRMTETMLAATETLVDRQVQMWQTTIDAAHQRWVQLSMGTQHTLEAAVVAGLTKTVEAHARQVASSQQQLDEQNRKHWLQLEQALVQATQAVTSQQSELVRQGEVLLKVVDATGQVTRLEDTLNRNLESLSGAHRFEEMLHSLSATVHLLSARHGGTAGQPVDLPSTRTGNHAA